MSKFPWGTTFTPEEKARMGLDPSSARIGTVKAHACSVTLPDGSPCPVEYARYQARYHLFRFQSPLCQKVYLSEQLMGGTQAIQEKAQELAPQAFHLAQAEEQKRMRRKTPPPGTKKQPTGEQDLSAVLAAACAGLYAVCIRFTTGHLMRMGAPTFQPEEAQAALLDGTFSKTTLYKGQRLVVGICNRPARRWVEPQFLASPEWIASRQPCGTSHTQKTGGAPSHSADGEEEEVSAEEEESYDEVTAREEDEEELS